MKLAAIACVVVSSALFAQNNGAISGRVTNSVTGVGIEGAQVWICPAVNGATRCSGTNYRTSSDSSGTFRFSGIPHGEYVTVEVLKDRFLSQLSSKTGLFPGFTESGESKLELRMAPYVRVRGRVFDVDGTLAEGARVTLGNLNMPEIVTGGNGEFVFDAVVPQCCSTLSATPKQEAANEDGDRTVTTYYPSVVDSAQATGIDIKGTELTFDIRLQTAWARPVQGVVFDVDGKPAASARLEITRTEPGLLAVMRGAPTFPLKQTEAARPIKTAKDGTFTFPPIREGEWTVRAEMLSNREITSAVAKVVLSRRDAQESRPLELRLARPFDLEVSADWGDSPPKNSLQNLALAGVISLESANDTMMARRPTGEPGKPQQVHLSGRRYLIWEGQTNGFASQPGFYAAAAILNGRDVLGQVVELSAPAALKMIYKQGGGTVRGTVEKGGGALVVLIADATANMRAGYTGRSDSNGVFSIPDLPPGSYTALAMTGAFPGDPRRPEFLAALARDGKRVRVEAGGTADVELRLALTQ